MMTGDAIRRFVFPIALLLLLLGPVAALLLYAGSVRWFYPDLLPREWTLQPILRQIGNPRTRDALAASLTIAGVTTLLALVIGLPAARVLGLRRFRGRGIVLLLLFLWSHALSLPCSACLRVTMKATNNRREPSAPHGRPYCCV